MSSPGVGDGAGVDAGPDGPNPWPSGHGVTAPYYADATVTIWQGDCLDVLPTLPDNSVDAVTTDPPYGLEFMGKDWDKFVPENRRNREWDNRRRDGKASDFAASVKNRGDGKPGGPNFSNAAHYKPNSKCQLCGKWQFDKNPCRCPQPDWEYRIRAEAPTQVLGFQAWCELWAAECLRILKPGGHLLAFGGTRTSHRLVSGIEDAGFEIRDSKVWLYGSGFPKSLNVGRAIDGMFCREAGTHVGDPEHVCPTTPQGDEWRAWGTALKPAHEPICVARKPLVGTVAANVLRYGTGALNIDACRIGTSDNLNGGAYAEQGGRTVSGSLNPTGMNVPGKTTGREYVPPAGRWPANVVLDESYEPILRLKYTIPDGVERAIREYFGASTGHLQELRGADRGATEPQDAEDLLLSEVLRGMDEHQHDGRERDPLGSGPLAGDTGEDLSNSGEPRTEGVEELPLDGRAVHTEGLRLRVPMEPAAGRAGAIRPDGEPQRPHLHPRTSASSSPSGGPAAAAIGARTPSQRDQGRQPVGEPGASRQQLIAPDEARSGGRGDVPATPRERAATPRTLEVLRRDVPPAWLRYFEETGRSRREGTAAALDQMSGELSSGALAPYTTTGSGRRGGIMGEKVERDHDYTSPANSGGASRFFYTAKASSDERITHNGVAHPTVKSLALMRWLVRLVTPPGGLILDPFAGSGTTVEAAILEGFRCIAIEREADYLPMITQRINRRRDPIAYITAAGEDLGLFADLAESDSGTGPDLEGSAASPQPAPGTG